MPVLSIPIFSLPAIFAMGSRNVYSTPKLDGKICHTRAFFITGQERRRTESSSGSMEKSEVDGGMSRREERTEWERGGECREVDAMCEM